MINEQKIFNEWYKSHAMQLAYTENYNAARLAWEERARHEVQIIEVVALKKERHNWKKETALANLKRILTDNKNKELKEALTGMIKLHMKSFGLDGAFDDELTQAMKALEERER